MRIVGGGLNVSATGAGIAIAWITIVVSAYSVIYEVREAMGCSCGVLIARYASELDFRFARSSFYKDSRQALNPFQMVRLIE